MESRTSSGGKTAVGRVGKGAGILKAGGRFHIWVGVQVGADTGEVQEAPVAMDATLNNPGQWL
eukprot:2672521-Pyramimonas_sp.AAC.1